MDRRSVAIVGGGPAGMSCAIWLNNYGITPLIVERGARLGGLYARSHYNNTFALGVLGRTGTQVAGDFAHHIRLNNTPVFHSRVVSSVQRSADGLSVTLHDPAGQGSGQGIQVQALVIATGTRFRRQEQLAGVSGVDEAVAQGRLQFGVPPRVDEMSTYADRDVVILGGGENAYEMAGYVSRVTRSTHLVVRGKISAKGSTRRRVHALSERITVWRDHVLSDLSTLCSDDMLTLRHPSSGRCVRLRADLISGQLGYRPNTEPWRAIFPDLDLDARGFIRADQAGRTSIERIYAAGDIANPSHPSATVAMAMGAVVAMSIEQDLREVLFPMV